MANRVRPKMAPADRAKQFLPFSALKGLEKALAVQEHLPMPKIELPEETAEELDRKMRLLHKGTFARITYFSRGEYKKIAGTISRIDENRHFLEIAQAQIPFDDVLEVQCDSLAFQDFSPA